jgi:hypothetical protein
MIVGTLLTVPAMGLALPSADMSKAKSSASTAATTEQAPMHATKGIVKAMDATKLVIRRSPSGPDMSFALNPSTQREGNVKVGSTVEVRYRTEANQKVATAVALAHTKAAPSAPAAHQ